MSGLRPGARSVLKWFSALYVVLIVVQVFLAGEGIFGLNNIKNSDDCDKSGAHCIANSKTLDPHRALGFILTGPGAILLSDRGAARVALQQADPHGLDRAAVPARHPDDPAGPRPLGRRAAPADRDPGPRPVRLALHAAAER